MNHPTPTEAPAQRRQRADGRRSRDTILDNAARLATVEGLDGLSIGRLAERTGMSKSGLYAHFTSKEALQLATIERAEEIFEDEVLSPARRKADGLRRLWALSDEFLSHLEREVFPGGCFFASAAAEVGTRRSRVRDAIAEIYANWATQLEELVREAQKAGRVKRSEDPAQLAFELNSILVGANNGYILQRDPAIFERAREAIARHVRA
jgi:AcrR family transcriptional regulator